MKGTDEDENKDKEKDKDGIGMEEEGLVDREGQEAPGQAVTHYAPDVPCLMVQSVSSTTSKGGKGVVEPSKPRPCNEIVQEGRLHLTESALLQHVVVLDFGGCLRRHLPGGPFLAYKDLSPTGSHVEAARGLFAALRWAELQPGASYILTARPAGSGGGPATNPGGGPATNPACAESVEMLAALEDRLFRATSGKIVDVVIE